jgi:glycosyltransferase involved in cell wall biosynthesis
MTVLIVSAAFPPMAVGEADHALHLTRHLSARGIDVHVLTSVGAATPGDLRATIHPVMRRWSWLELPRFGALIKRISPDAVLLVYLGVLYRDHPMVTFAPTVSKRVMPDAAFVTQFENVFGTIPSECPLPTRIARRVAKMLSGSETVDYEFGTLLRDSDRLVVLSDSHRPKLARQSIDVPAKTMLIPPPPLLRLSPEKVDRPKLRRELGASDADFLLAYFGYIYPGKGLETLLRALRLLRDQDIRVKLAAIGGVGATKSADRPRYAEEVHELATELSVQDHVTWTGGYDWESDRASQYLRAADACVFPLDSGVYLNNSSMAAAASHGRPIVATRGRADEPALIDRENVLLCPPRCPESLAAALRELVGSPSLQARLAEGARSLARRWFDWESVVDRTLAALSVAPLSSEEHAACACR